jgi:hypothetical protein
VPSPSTNSSYDSFWDHGDLKLYEPDCSSDFALVLRLCTGFLICLASCFISSYDIIVCSSVSFLAWLDSRFLKRKFATLSCENFSSDADSLCSCLVTCYSFFNAALLSVLIILNIDSALSFESMLRLILGFSDFLSITVDVLFIFLNLLLDLFRPLRRSGVQSS